MFDYIKRLPPWPRFVARVFEFLPVVLFLLAVLWKLDADAKQDVAITKVTQDAAVVRQHNADRIDDLEHRVAALEAKR